MECGLIASVKVYVERQVDTHRRRRRNEADLEKEIQR